MSSPRPPRYFWAPLMRDWWSCPEHTNLSRDALWVGAVALVMARCSPEPGWLVTPAGPIDMASLAREARTPKRETALAVLALESVGTLTRRPLPDGALGFGDFERWVKTPEAQRKQAWRDSKRRGEQSDMSKDKSRDMSQTGLATSHGTKDATDHSSQITPIVPSPARLELIPPEAPPTKVTREEARAAAEARTAKLTAVISAWNRGADSVHQEPAPGPESRTRDERLIKAMTTFGDPAKWEACARALCADPWAAPRFQLSKLLTKASEPRLEDLMRDGQRITTPTTMKPMREV